MAKNTAGSIPADPTPEPDTFSKEKDDALARKADADDKLDTQQAEAQRVEKAKASVNFDPETIPPGFAAYHNPTDKDVRFVVMDEGNRPRPVQVKAGKVGLVPVEYARIVPQRAPQLVELGRRAALSPEG